MEGTFCVVLFCFVLIVSILRKWKVRFQEVKAINCDAPFTHDTHLALMNRHFQYPGCSDHQSQPHFQETFLPLLHAYFILSGRFLLGLVYETSLTVILLPRQFPRASLRCFHPQTQEQCQRPGSHLPLKQVRPRIRATPSRDFRQYMLGKLIWARKRDKRHEGLVASQEDTTPRGRNLRGFLTALSTRNQDSCSSHSLRTNYMIREVHLQYNYNKM